jgi:hypothetical protein
MQIKGFKYPFQLGPDGRVAMSEDIEHLKQNVIQIILTRKGEMPFLPKWGCSLANRVFDPVNAQSFAESEIRAAIKKHEPRVEVTKIEANIDRAYLGILDIDIEIKQVGTEQTARAYVEVGR